MKNRTEQNRTEQNHYYLLTNNLNFNILQFFKTLNDFLGVRFLLQKFFSNIVKRLLFELSQFKQNFNFARNIYLNIFNKNQGV